VATRVVEKLGLQTDAAFLGLSTLKNEEERRERAKRMDAAAILQSKVSVSPIKESRVVNVVVNDVDPARAALLANEVADAYIAETLSLKMKMTENASMWLEDRLKSLESEAKRSELAVYDLKKKSDILETSLQDRQSMVSQRLQSYNSTLTEVKTKIASEVASLASGDGSWMKNPLLRFAVTIPIVVTTTPVNGERWPAPWMVWIGVGATSSFEIVPWPCVSPGVAPVMLVTLTKKVSFGSTVVSPLTVTAKV
jgi:hypothetical protein